MRKAVLVKNGLTRQAAAAALLPTQGIAERTNVVVERRKCLGPCFSCGRPYDDAKRDVRFDCRDEVYILFGIVVLQEDPESIGQAELEHGIGAYAHEVLDADVNTSSFDTGVEELREQAVPMLVLLFSAPCIEVGGRCLWRCEPKVFETGVTDAYHGHVQSFD